MEKDLSNHRKVYEKGALTKASVPENPMELFQKWFYEVENFGSTEEVNAMTISTIGLDNFPKSRVVLLKKFNREGFIFFTNYLSEKGKAIEANPNICLSFFWNDMEQQIIIKGVAEKTTKNISDGYFESRPSGSKLGAWCSKQSSILSSRKTLDTSLRIFEEKYKNLEIPRPDNWGGYLVKPISIEFWQGRPNRMHDRIRYSLQKNFDWKIERLAP
jgi:pyridoxamine 5'-phosphate oxidase|tara:strand:- start:110 stop:757 length:648 start_codon:yes stop_codon:yes gene_type:complete